MQKKRLATLLAVIGIGGILAVLGLRLWASSARNSMPELSMVHTGTDGHIYVLLADTLYVEDDDGNSLSVTPLAKFGLHGFWGDFAPLSDGSIILPSRPQPADTAQKEADIYARKPVTAEQEEAEGVPLTHCYPATGQCTVLKGSGGKSFKADRTFKLAVDERAGRIYVADTAGQRLLILDMQGDILAQKTEGLRFPNGLMVTPKGTLLATDTNHFRLLEFDVSGDSFAANPDETSVAPWPGDLLQRFPTGVAQDSDGSRWVVVADNGIAHGRLYRLAPDGKKGIPVPMPAGDALYVSIGNADALVPDMATYRIYRFDRDGGALPDFGSPVLAAALEPLARQRAIYDAIFKYSLAAMVAMLVLLLLAQHVSKLAKADPDMDIEAPPQLGQVAAKLAPPPSSFGISGWRGGEYLFRRRLAGALNRSGRRWGLALMVLLVVIILLMIIGLESSMADRSPHPANAIFRAQMDGFAIGSLIMIWALFCLFSYRYERLRVDQKGIRYETPLAGPLSFLAPLYPSWSLQWDELQALRLSNGAGGALAQQWYYELETRDGRIRRVSALQWRRTDVPDETDLGFRDARSRDPELLHAAITRTGLYQVMSLARKAVDARNAPAATV